MSLVPTEQAVIGTYVNGRNAMTIFSSLPATAGE